MVEIVFVCRRMKGQRKRKLILGVYSVKEHEPTRNSLFVKVIFKTKF